MKRWIDANKIEMIHELPTRRLRRIDKEMREKPRYDKRNEKKKKSKS